jgi:hypothetical protein
MVTSKSECMRVIEFVFDFGAEVYLKTDREQYRRMVTGYKVTPAGITYEVSCGVLSSWHYDFELSLEKDVLITTTD